MDDLNVIVLKQLLVATAMVTVVVTIHFIGLFVLTSFVRANRPRFAAERMTLGQIAVLIASVLGLFVVHAVEIWFYALFYLWVGATINLEAALYFSLTSYATIGYGDIVLPHDWRILGAIEGVNGILMLGWSIAFLVSVVGRFRHMQHR